MKRSDILLKDMSFLKSGSTIPVMWYEDLAALKVPEPERPLLVIARGRDISFDEFAATIQKHKPRFVVPPFSQTDQNFTSAAAERVRAQGQLSSEDVEVIVGVVLCGRGDNEELDFLVWAHEKGYMPIVIPPDRRPRTWQIGQMFQHGAIGSGWYHLAGGDQDLDVSEFPGIWTFGEAL